MVGIIGILFCFAKSRTSGSSLFSFGEIVPSPFTLYQKGLRVSIAVWFVFKVCIPSSMSQEGSHAETFAARAVEEVIVDEVVNINKVIIDVKIFFIRIS